jgi:predicted ribosome quality control (RQC) complex YloA/Tae2 family protein
MKVRLTLADLLAEVRDLRSSVLGQRLVNVYDAATPGETGAASKTTFLLKFSEPGREKAVVVVESGVRLHTTRYARDKPSVPGGFTMKLRKHVRGRRCTRVSLRGLDRVLDLAFGSGPAEHHLLIELYDRGNVVLADSEFRILALLRNYVLDAPPAPALAIGAPPAGPAAAETGGAAGGGCDGEPRVVRARSSVRRAHTRRRGAERRGRRHGDIRRRG